MLSLSINHNQYPFSDLGYFITALLKINDNNSLMIRFRDHVCIIDSELNDLYFYQVYQGSSKDYTIKLDMKTWRTIVNGKIINWREHLIIDNFSMYYPGVSKSRSDFPTTELEFIPLIHYDQIKFHNEDTLSWLLF